MSFEAGDKVQYKNTKGDWRDGVVHGVKKVEGKKGRVTSLSYLIDTGKSVGEVPIMPEGKNPNSLEAGEKVEPLEMQKQPQQIEVAADEVRKPEK